MFDAFLAHIQTHHPQCARLSRTYAYIIAELDYAFKMDCIFYVQRIEPYRGWIKCNVQWNRKSIFIMWMEYFIMRDTGVSAANCEVKRRRRSETKKTTWCIINIRFFTRNNILSSFNIRNAFLHFRFASKRSLRYIWDKSHPKVIIYYNSPEICGWIKLSTN